MQQFDVKTHNEVANVCLTIQVRLAIYSSYIYTTRFTIAIVLPILAIGTISIATAI